MGMFLFKIANNGHACTQQVKKTYVAIDDSSNYSLALYPKPEFLPNEWKITATCCLAILGTCQVYGFKHPCTILICLCSFLLLYYWRQSEIQDEINRQQKVRERQKKYEEKQERIRQQKQTIKEFFEALRYVMEAIEEEERLYDVC